MPSTTDKDHLANVYSFSDNLLAAILYFGLDAYIMSNVSEKWTQVVQRLEREEPADVLMLDCLIDCSIVLVMLVKLMRGEIVKAETRLNRYPTTPTA